MRILPLLFLLFLTTCMQTTPNVLGTLLESAKDCDAARAKLIELVKTPDTDEVSKLMDSLGVDVLNSCDIPKGNLICFQCIDRNNELRSLQLFHDSDTKKFEFLGFGCRCKDEE